MTERRYSDEETAAIFRLAAEGQSPPATQLSRLDGLSLGELKAIGHEVGIPGDAVSRAAQLMEIRKSARSRRLLGLPVGVERRVELGRKMSDEEWERLVVELRDVFQARGRIRAEGGLRQWTNGNLYVLLEPTTAGDRLRLGSTHGGAAMSIRLGIMALGTAAMLAILRATVGESGTAIPALLSGGLLLLANGALRVPGWARLRGRQMEDLAARVAPPIEAPTGPRQLPEGSEP